MWERIGNCFNVPQGRRKRVKEFEEEKEILFLVRYLVLTSAAAIHFLPFFPGTEGAKPIFLGSYLGEE